MSDEEDRNSQGDEGIDYDDEDVNNEFEAEEEEEDEEERESQILDGQQEGNDKTDQQNNDILDTNLLNALHHIDD